MIHSVGQQGIGATHNRDGNFPVNSLWEGLIFGGGVGCVFTDIDKIWSIQTFSKFERGREGWVERGTSEQLELKL